ncbi:MAG: hypothetical protein EPO08_01075 [Rhodospirillaceae bacterium]|nr:MAG: hypothetical protein EPO08_01075 [Rhodospirillaceae bacterium]
MSKFALIQACYCITGILFFVRDLFAKVPMGVAMVHAFIWPYAQWLVIKSFALQEQAQALDLIHRYIH